MEARRAIVAGQFYPGRRESCIAELQQALVARSLPAELPDEIVGGIVPHAGWVFSGSLAALVFSAVKKRHERVDTFVLFGAAHSYFGQMPAIWAEGSWESPLGEVAVDEAFAAAVIKAEAAVDDRSAHRMEHSIEVQLPFVQYLFADASIVPIVVPPNERAVRLGEVVGRIIEQAGDKKVVCIGSTDLTHYGPRYNFAPVGVGVQAIRWADANDRRFIDLALQLQPEPLLASAAEHRNACGAGAAAAAVAAARRLGKERALLLAHTSSNEVMLRKMGTTSQESVGYAAIIF